MADLPSPAAAPRDRRSAILAAACELFSQRGFAATPVPLIAARAGVAAGTLYRYFPSKEALANRVYRECKLGMTRSLADAGAAGLDARREFDALWRGLRSFARAQPDAFRFLELHDHASLLDAESRAAADALFERIADFVRRGQAEGALRRGDAAVLVSLAFGAFVGLVKGEREQHFVLDDEAFETSVQAAWSLLSSAARDAGAAT